MPSVHNGGNMYVGIILIRGSLGSPRRRLKDNIRMDLEEKGFNAVNCVDSTQD